MLFTKSVVCFYYYVQIAAGGNCWPESKLDKIKLIFRRS
jgi:hypothetical protein